MPVRIAKMKNSGLPWVVQWLRICQPKKKKRICQPMMQVQSLVWEDSTCCRGTKPMGHNY